MMKTILKTFKLNIILFSLITCANFYGQNDLTLTASESPFNLANSGDKFYKDIIYGNDVENNGLDIFLPEFNEPTSLLIIIHGGGFINGDKADVYENTFYTGLINNLLSRNIAVATINYYLVKSDDSDGILRSLKDSKRALQFMRYHASTLNLDKNKVAIFGTSAGAATALWIAVKDDMADNENTDAILRESTRVEAIVLGSPQNNYDCLEWHNNVFSEYKSEGFSYETVKNILGESRIFNYFGVSSEAELLSDDNKTYRDEVNMLSFLTSDDPEIYASSSVEYKIPTNSSELYHHPLMVKGIKDKAENIGLSGKYYIPDMGIDTRNGESTQDFIVRKIGKTSYPPSVVLNIGSNFWKINSFDGVPGNSAVYYDDITTVNDITFKNYEDENYFYTDNEWVYFKCFVGLESSKSSGNPRVELRELENGNLANWDGSIEKHEMQWTVKVNQLPDSKNDGDSGTVCFAQIHGPENNAQNVNVDDIIRVQFTGDANQSSGNVRLKISGYLPDINGESVFIDNGYTLGSSYTFKLEYFNSKVTLYQISGGIATNIYSASINTSAEGNYFKVGNYLQSVQEMSFDGDFGLVAIKDLTLTHNTNFGTKVQIPDNAFEAYLEEEFASIIVVDGDKTDGSIIFSDIDAVLDIDFNSPDIANATTFVVDLTGINSFPQLKYLIARNNNITGNVDLSGLVKLSKVYIDNNPSLTGLNFTGCELLQQVKASQCNLSNLDLSTANLNTSDINRLTDVDVDTNNLAVLNISGHTGIDYLDAGTNTNLEEIDISKLTLLTLFRFQKCNIQGAVDVSKNLSLTSLSAYDNDNLTSINLDAIPYTNFTYLKTNSSSLLSCIYTDNPSHFEIGGDLQSAIGSSYAVDEHTNFVLDEAACAVLNTENLDKAAFVLYPNLSNGEIKIATQEKGVFKIVNLTGKTLKTGKLNKGENQIDIADLAAGLYLFHFVDENNKTGSQKIIKK